MDPEIYQTDKDKESVTSGIGDDPKCLLCDSENRPEGNEGREININVQLESVVLEVDAVSNLTSSTHEDHKPNEDNNESGNEDNDGNGKTAEEIPLLMPEEQLCSDDSDTAGYYQVNAVGGAGSEGDEVSLPSYQRGIPSSSSDDSSSDSDDDTVLPRLRRRLAYDTSSSDSSSEDGDGEVSLSDLNIDINQVKVKHSLFLQSQSRVIGDFGCKRNYTNSTQKLMGNLNFVRRLQCAKKLEFHSGCVNALNFNSSGTMLASGSDDTKVVIWDMRTYKPYMNFNSGHESNVFQTKFMPHSNDSQVVTASRDGNVRLAELSATGTCRSTKKLAQHMGSAHKLAVENDPAHCLLSCGEDAVVFQIDLRVKKPTRLVQTLHEGRRIPLYSIDKNPHNPYEFVVGGKDHFIRVYDKRKIAKEGPEQGILKKFCPHKFSDMSSKARDVTCAVYNYNGTEIIGTYNDDDIYLFCNEHSDGADSVGSYSGHRNSATIKGVNFYGPQSEYIVSGSDCGNVFLWDKHSSQVLQIQKADEGGVVNVLEPHPHFPYLAVSGLDNDIKVFMPIGEELTDMSKYARLIKQNKRKRNSALNLFSTEIDRHFLLAAMRHMEFRRRRMAGQRRGGDAAEDGDGSESRGGAGSSSARHDTDSDSDNEDDSSQPNGNLPCVTS